jgi:adenylosuccinate lyase
MIPRYSGPEMSRIWEPENRLRIWFEIEAHACDAQAALGSSTFMQKFKPLSIKPNWKEILLFGKFAL